MENRLKLTIFTPTYNRGKFLYRLFDSIMKQNSKDIEWLIVDDGSVDNTKKIVENFQKSSKFPIRYIYQHNSGKWKAFNNGVLNAYGELFFCVDSDDMLYENAINSILMSWEFAKENRKICGILGKKIDLNGKELSSKLPLNIKYIDTYMLTNELKCTGEFALIYLTEVLKDNLFPDTGEKFITENVIYDKISSQYQLLLLNQILNICEYQNDGLSQNIYKIMLKNPIGYKIYYSQRINMARSYNERLNYVVRYNTFSLIAKTNKFEYNGPWKWLIILTRPWGFVLKYYYERKIK